MEREVLENHKLYLRRKKLYQQYGFEIDKESKFVLDKAEPLFGDILEVGTGKGHFTLTLAKEGYRFTSVDISKEEQNIAKLNLRHFGLERSVDFRIENAEQLSFEDKSFDMVFSINTVHHFNKPFKILDEFIRVVSFEGKIVISDFTNDGFDTVDMVHAAEGRAHKKSGIALQEVQKYLIEKGFKVDRYKSKFQEVLTGYHRLI